MAVPDDLALEPGGGSFAALLHSVLGSFGPFTEVLEPVEFRLQESAGVIPAVLT